jgi:branched-chain amino acid transport system substrate-binding protein
LLLDRRTAGGDRRRRIRSIFAVGASIFLLLAAGCSSSKAGTTGAGSTHSSSATSAAGSPATPTGAPLVIGAVGSDSSPGLGTTTDFPKTLQSWETWVNDHGGINGHPVKVTEHDDQSNPGLSKSIVDAFLAQHVIAVFDDSNVSTAWQTDVQKANTPVIGMTHSGESAPYITNPDFFGAGMNIEIAWWGQVLAAQISGKTRFGVMYCAEIAACQAIADGIKRLAPIGNVQVAYSAAISASAPNYTALCVSAQNAGANSVVIDASVTKVADDCARQNYHPQWIESEGTLNQHLRSDPAYNGVLADVAYAPWFLDTTPALKEFHTAVGDLVTTSAVPYVVIGSWTGAKLFQAAAQSGVAASDQTPSSTDIYNGLYSLNGTTLGGLSASPETFTKGQPGALACFYLMGIKDGQWSAPYGLHTYCAPPAALKALGMASS